jgi:D-alanyl-D-alanine carboxypeptidase/D-alanyl-D-alanine-endopeptidase (penicillin-binding protein 4)
MAGAQGCVLAQQGDTTVFAASADMPLAPASTLKLLTAAAALTRLGPDFRFQTTVVSAAPPQDGAVDDLWLVGSGDPVLWTPEYSAFSSRQPEMAGFLSTPLAGLADGVAAAGVRSVARGVHGDDSHLDRTRYVPSWPAKYRSDVDVGPLGALSVDGGLQAWEPKAVAADDPASLASGALARLLSARGVTAGGAGDEPAPAHPVVLARVQSPSLSELVTGMLRVSDNYTAELLVREMDRHAGGPGTTAGGVAEVARALADLGLPTSGMHLVDGSGLDPANRSTCRLELAAMDLGRRPGLGAIEAGLARAAASGTLIHRFQGTPEAGRLEAKTGWIGGAVAIVGHMEVKAPLRFAFIANGSFGWAVARPLEDRVVQALATWPETS